MSGTVAIHPSPAWLNIWHRGKNTLKRRLMLLPHALATSPVQVEEVASLSRILSIHTDSRAESLRVARKRVSEAILGVGANPEVASDVEVAVGEALSNVSRHAYNGAAWYVGIQLDQTGPSMIVTVSDDGRATIPPVVPETLPSPARTGGRGLYLMSRLVDDVIISVNATGHGLVVHLTRRVLA
jgi:serine/threonine-protein kinase RsbW